MQKKVVKMLKFWDDPPPPPVVKIHNFFFLFRMRTSLRSFLLRSKIVVHAQFNTNAYKPQILRCMMEEF